MKIFTVQLNEVVNKIISNDIYFIKPTDEFLKSRGNLEQPYRNLIEVLNFKTSPIFGCVEGEKCEFFGCPIENSKIIVLDVPEDKVILTDYYNWVDYIFSVEQNDWDYYATEYVIPKNTVLEDLVLARKTNINVYQAILPFILREWVIGVYPITQKFSDYHIGSGGNHILRPINFYIDINNIKLERE